MIANQSYGAKRYAKGDCWHGEEVHGRRFPAGCSPRGYWRALECIFRGKVPPSSLYPQPATPLRGEL